MMKIVGKQDVDYTSRKTNQQVTGVTLYVTCPDSKVDGVRAESIFISSRSLCYPEVMKLPVGAGIEVYYNRFGSVEDVRPNKN